MNILEAQISSVICIFFSMSGTFLLPFWFMHSKSPNFDLKYRTILTQANCLSGGVFLATFFIGLMPEVRSLYQQIFTTYEVSYKFPITEFVIFIGFLLALGIEQCALEFKERTEVKPKDNKSDGNIEISRCDSNYNELTSGHGHSHHDMATSLIGNNGSNIRLGMLLVSLGVHSLFEGLALGLQTSVATLIRLAIGVALHELLMAFALGVSVAKLRLPFITSCKLAIFFSAAIPVGQLLGLLIGQYPSNATLVISATLQGLAAGTFIHVTFMEIIPTEFNEKENRFLKVFSLGLGFVLILVCTVLMQNLGHISHMK